MKKRQTPDRTADQMDLFGRGPDARASADGVAGPRESRVRKCTRAGSPSVKTSPPRDTARTTPYNTLLSAPSGDALLNVRQAAARLGLSKSTLDKMRCHGIGPKFIKSTNRAVRYDPHDLGAWVEARRRQSTEKPE